MTGSMRHSLVHSTNIIITAARFPVLIPLGVLVSICCFKGFFFFCDADHYEIEC